ncbi:MAG: hypothetical protein CMP44_04255 [Rickettsiales bacterium]|jgi:hypothetical protein|nr:hypothetical protein [Rickettsiales bacterium]
MKKFLSLIIIFIISFYILIEFVGDKLIKNILESNISASLNRDVSIDKLNIDYLNGQADAKGINLLNKNFDGYLVRIDSIKVDLDAFSIFSNDVIINDVLLDNIKVNYYFNFSDQIISDNVRSLEQELKNKTSYSNSNKYFNIKSLNAKNISLSAKSPSLNFEKTINLNDMNFNNIGNTNQSKNYKDVLKEVFNDTVDIVKEKVLSGNILDKLENFNPEEIENKIKDKLKNKLKKLIK